jgi:hypothetical protein
MIKSLLGQSAQDKGRVDFMLYIIASCSKKMVYRIDNGRSETYYDCLQGMETFTFKKLPFDKEKAHGDKPLAQAIPRLAKSFQLKIPNLLEAAEQETIEIYKESTCHEFHFLLCELLSTYKKSLKNLEKSIDILKDLKAVRVMGFYLRVLVGSYATEIHLQSIEHLLKVDSSKMWTHMPEEDPDFDRIRAHSMRKGKQLKPWESYRDWLLLMVHYFDAASILTSHVSEYKFKPDTISITILSPQRPEAKMLSWTEFLKDDSLFPAVTGESSGEEFVKFFKETAKVKCDVIELAIKSAELLKGELGEESNPLDPLALDERTKELTGLLMGCVLGSVRCPDLEQIRDKILELKDVKPKNQSDEVQKVLDMLLVFGKRGMFSGTLGKKKLEHGEEPSGTYHCEAFLASFISLWEPSGEGSSRKHVSDFDDRLNTFTKVMKEVTEVVDGIKVCHISMHRLKLY